MSDLSPNLSAKEFLLPPSPSSPSSTRPSRPRTLIFLLVFVPTSLLFFTAGVLIGTHLPHITRPQSDLPHPPGNVHQIWHHNLTFSQAPTPGSEAAWGSLIPMGRGFIHEETIAPFISNIAVFHQLHCLHAILIAYYIALSSPPTTPPAAFDTETGARTAMPHVRHCFDYLRQSVMCASDTNLEIVDRDTRLTNGWGQEKVCRNYEGVKAFAERWANSSDTGIVAFMDDMVSSDLED